MNLWYLFFFIINVLVIYFILLFGAEDWTQGFAYAKHILSYWVTVIWIFEVLDAWNRMYANNCFKKKVFYCSYLV
jgi:hypothetical protein